MEILLAKQTKIRRNIKDYFDLASEGTVIKVPRIAGKNVVILSEELFCEMQEAFDEVTKEKKR